MAYEIEISDNQRYVAVDKQQLLRTVRYVLESMGVKQACVSVALVDNETIVPLKERYYGKAVVTDVLSFNLADGLADIDGRLDCEIIVNPQLASQRVKQLGQKDDDNFDTDVAAELNLYVVHGLLHQLGYDDTDDKQAAAMHTREDELLEQLGFGRVFYKDK